MAQGTATNRGICRQPGKGASFRAFLTSDPKGRRVPGYLSHLAAALDEERGQAVRETQAQQKNVERLKEMGGGLYATSDGLGHGASFTLELPITEPMETTGAH